MAETKFVSILVQSHLKLRARMRALCLIEWLFSRAVSGLFGGLSVDSSSSLIVRFQYL